MGALIEAVPKSWWSNDYLLRSSDGSLALLDVSNWRERAEFEIEGVMYHLYREGLVRGAFVLAGAGGIVVRAFKPSPLRDGFEMELNGTSYALRKVSMFGRPFGAFRGDEQVGTISPLRLASRRAVIDLPADWPAPVQVFVFWLALVIWSRRKPWVASHGGG